MGNAAAQHRLATGDIVHIPLAIIGVATILVIVSAYDIWDQWNEFMGSKMAIEMGNVGEWKHSRLVSMIIWITSIAAIPPWYELMSAVYQE